MDVVKRGTQLDAPAGDHAIMGLLAGDEWGPTVASLRDVFGLRRKVASDIVCAAEAAIALAAEPCKHPDRRGRHEWYGDRLHTGCPRWLCRACGARGAGNLPQMKGSPDAK